MGGAFSSWAGFFILGPSQRRVAPESESTPRVGGESSVVFVLHMASLIRTQLSRGRVARVGPTRIRQPK